MDYQLNMIDVLKEPGKAKQAGIFGTPTLVYHSPDGDKTMNTLSDIALVRGMLGIAE